MLHSTRLGVLAAFILSNLCFCGCGGHSAPPSAETSAPPVISLTLSPTLRGDTLVITGSTDLPNGTLIAYEIRHEGEYTPLATVAVPSLNSFSIGTSATESLKGWPPGKIEVWGAFQTILGRNAKQPPEVISRFGELGEKLQGNNVTKAGSTKRVEVTETLALRR